MTYPWEKPPFEDIDTSSRKEYARKWRAENRTRYLLNLKTYYEANKETILEYKKNWRRNNRDNTDYLAAKMVNGAASRARKAELPFDKAILTHVKTILAEGICELSGLPFESSVGKRGPYSPSLDRIEPELGYVLGNIRVILWSLNAALSVWGLDVTLDIFRAVLKQDVDREINKYVKFMNERKRVVVSINGTAKGSFAVLDEGINMNIETIMPDGMPLIFRVEGHPRTTDPEMTIQELVAYVLANYTS